MKVSSHEFPREREVFAGDGDVVIVPRRVDDEIPPVFVLGDQIDIVSKSVSPVPSATL